MAQDNQPSADKGGLHIFVNRKKFEEGDGVKSEMTGGELAGLIGVPPENAVVRWDSGPKKGEEIGVGASVPVQNGAHFLVTRKVVEGG